MYQGEGPGLLLTGKHHGGTTGDTGEQRGTGITGLHGSRFDLRSGKPDSLPATRPVPVYPVKIEGDDVLVSLTQES